MATTRMTPSPAKIAKRNEISENGSAKKLTPNQQKTSAPQPLSREQDHKPAATEPKDFETVLNSRTQAASAAYPKATVARQTTRRNLQRNQRAYSGSCRENCRSPRETFSRRKVSHDRQAGRGESGPRSRAQNWGNQARNQPWVRKIAALASSVFPPLEMLCN
jgi:hypothetical protein